MRRSFVVCVALVVCGSSVGGVVDFETTPSGGGASDDTALDLASAYDVEGVGVRFGFDIDDDRIPDNPAAFERRGDDGANGFFSSFGSLGFDSERPSDPQLLGQFFVRQAVSIGGLPGNFVVVHDADASAVSGEIWDIDASSLAPTETERWRVSAYDSGGELLASVESPAGISDGDPGSLDSRPWTFSFEGVGPIRRVVLEFTGTKTSGIGLAFDNYSLSPALCAGDVNGDGATDVFDFTDLASNFGAGPGATRAQGDVNGDGFVDVFDFADLASDFGCGG